MDYELRISPQALEEIDQAFDYYSKISEQVAFNFHEELEKILNTLEFSPHFQKRYREIRAIPFPAFPYLVFYSVENKIVSIHSVFHTSQNPDKYPGQ